MRTVTVPRHIRADLKHHLDTYTGSEPDALLFGSDESRCGHLNSTTVRRHFNAALAASGYDGPHVRIHDLRHHHGTMITLAGATLRDSMSRLGHTTVAASLRYQQIVAGRDAEIAERLSALAESETYAD